MWDFQFLNPFLIYMSFLTLTDNMLSKELTILRTLPFQVGRLILIGHKFGEVVVKNLIPILSRQVGIMVEVIHLHPH